MGRRAVIIKAATVLIALWLVVWGIRSWAGSRRISVEMIDKEVAAAHLDDWSGDHPSNATEAARRDKEVRHIAGLVNRLDFRERQKNRNERLDEKFYQKLDPEERKLFVDLTIRETMDTFVTALDTMPADQRRKFVDDALRDLAKGKTEAEMQKTRELGDNLVERAGQEGTRAYFEKASADTKLDLAPLMDAMNDLLKGMHDGPR